LSPEIVKEYFAEANNGEKEPEYTLTAVQLRLNFSFGFYSREGCDLETLQSFVLHLQQVFHSLHSSSSPSLSQVVHTNLMAQMMHLMGSADLGGFRTQD